MSEGNTNTGDPQDRHGGRVYINIPEELYNRMERRAKELDMDLDELIRDAVERWIRIEEERAKILKEGD